MYDQTDMNDIDVMYMCLDQPEGGKRSSLQFCWSQTPMQTHLQGFMNMAYLGLTPNENVSISTIVMHIFI